MSNIIEINVKTVKKIRDMAYNGKDEFFSDKTLRQFKLRKQKTKTVYIVELKVNEEFHREVIGDTHIMAPTEARNRATKLINDIKYNHDKFIEQKVMEQYERKTLQDAFDDYLANKKLATSTIQEYTRILGSDFGSWLSLLLKSITRDMLIDKFKEISERAPSEANHARRFINSIFNFAEEFYKENDYKLIQDNPCKFSKFAPFNKEKPKKRRIYKNNLPAFWKVTELTSCDTRKMAQTKILCRLCILTGCREQEICTLKRKHIDLENKVIYLEHTKNGNEHKIIYSEYVGELMIKLCDGLAADDYLFPAGTKSGHLQDHSKYISKLRKDSGLSFSLHDLRRSFTTYGSTFCHIKAEMLEAMTNHQSDSVTFKRYVTAGPDTFPVYRKHFQKIENFVMKHIGK